MKNSGNKRRLLFTPSEIILVPSINGPLSTETWNSFVSGTVPQRKPMRLFRNFLFLLPTASFLVLQSEGKQCNAREPCKWIEDECKTRRIGTIARCTPGKICRDYEYPNRQSPCPDGYKLHRTVSCPGDSQNELNYRHFCCKENDKYTVNGLTYLTPNDYANSGNFPDMPHDNPPPPHPPIHTVNTTKSVFITNSKWPRAEIPLYINYSLSGWNTQQRAEITKSLQDYESKTCIRFYAAGSADRYWVSLENDPVTNTATNCGLSQICGPIGGRQFCSVGPACAEAEWIIHELGHSLCYNHEQIRPDRDNYIYFDSRVCNPEPIENSRYYTTQGLPFDYQSMMLYGGCTPGRCIQRRQGSGPCGGNGSGTGQSRLSRLDTIRMNLFYNCDCNRYLCQ